MLWSLFEGSGLLEPRCSSCTSKESLDVCDMPEASWIGVLPVPFSVKAPLAINEGKIHKIKLYHDLQFYQQKNSWNGFSVFPLDIFYLLPFTSFSVKLVLDWDWFAIYEPRSSSSITGGLVLSLVLDTDLKIYFFRKFSVKMHEVCQKIYRPLSGRTFRTAFNLRSCISGSIGWFLFCDIGEFFLAGTLFKKRKNSWNQSLASNK